MASKQEAGIRRQIELPLSQAVKMARDSIRVRFWRSMITAAGIFLGIAFLESVLTTSVILKSIGEGYDEVVHTRQNWLVVMSLLVSTVGVVNSMLMSVNERYREIGTMKCLGALDRLVVKVFLIEAGFTGLIASVAGALVGTGIMSLVLWGRFGGRFWMALASAFTEMVRNIGIGIAIGTVLSLVAAFYPAWRAAKMPPAAALRSEF